MDNRLKAAYILAGVNVVSAVINVTLWATGWKPLETLKHKPVPSMQLCQPRQATPKEGCLLKTEGGWNWAADHALDGKLPTFEYGYPLDPQRVPKQMPNEPPYYLNLLNITNRVKDGLEFSKRRPLTQSEQNTVQAAVWVLMEDVRLSRTIDMSEELAVELVTDILQKAQK